MTTSLRHCLSPARAAAGPGSGPSRGGGGRRTHLRTVLLAMAALGAAACAGPPGPVGSGFGLDAGAPDLALIDPLYAAGSSGEAQRRLLPNDTALPGENYLITMPNRRLTGRMSLAGILRAAGPLPHPFEYVIDRDFVPVPGAPALGYAKASPEEGVSCVFVAGSTGFGGAVTMRNCVRGDVALALAPIAAQPAF